MNARENLIYRGLQKFVHEHARTSNTTQAAAVDDACRLIAYAQTHDLGVEPTQPSGTRIVLLEQTVVTAIKSKADGKWGARYSVTLSGVSAPLQVDLDDAGLKAMEAAQCRQGFSGRLVLELTEPG